MAPAGSRSGAWQRLAIWSEWRGAPRRDLLTVPFDVVPGESPLHGLIRWRSTELGFEWARGLGAIGSAFAGHDRVVLVDEEPDELDEAGLPADIPLYAWDTTHFRGDVPGHPGLSTDVAPVAPTRLVFPGLDDSAFSVIPLIEAVRAGHRPW